jgi:tRNA pseudouridine38-40 synthase
MNIPEPGNTPSRYKLVIEYDGSDFCGWQFQLNGRSVQEAIEQAASRILQERIRVYGAGRTDAGVHATGQVAHFDSHTSMPVSRVLRGMNAVLPEDVCIRSMEKAEDSFHARFSASSREYKYTITQHRIACGRQYCLLLHTPLDSGRILPLMAVLTGTHDFTAMSKASDDVNNYLCHVFDARWTYEGGRHEFTIRANRFVRGMVRAVTSALIEVGRGRQEIEWFRSLLESSDRSMAPPLAPPNGLVLTGIRYDREEYAFVREILRLPHPPTEE